VADPTWAPFLSTPNHPSYISGHSGQSGAAAAVLAAFFGTDNISFSFSNDSLPGVTRSYASFSQALQECGDSRVYAGIHWRFDCVVAQDVGRTVGDYVMDHFLLPRDHGDDGDDQLRAAAATPALLNTSLRSDQVQALPAEALVRWQAAGADTSALWGRFVDATPRGDSESTTPGAQGEARRTDLPTVLGNEVGRLLGRDHHADGGVQENVGAGSRRTIGLTLALTTDGHGDAQTLFAWDAEMS
jgi:hypothetical protein